LGKLSSAVLRSLAKHPNPRLREHVARLSEPFLDKDSDLLAQIVLLADDEDVRVRFQVAFSLGECNDRRAASGLVRLAKSSGGDRDVRIAILSSAAGRAGQLIGELTGDSEFLAQPHASAFISELVVSIGSIPDNAAALDLLVGIARPELSPQMQQTVLTALGEGLKRRGVTLSSLLSDKATNKQVRAKVDDLFRLAIKNATDEKQSLMPRATAIGLLAFADYAFTESTLEPFLSPQTPQILQRAAVAALSQQDAENSGRLLIAHWRGYSPTTRRDVTDGLLSSVARIDLLLKALQERRIQPRELDRDKIQVLLNHPNAKIKAASAKLLGGSVVTDRTKVVADFQKILDLERDVTRGLQVFTKKCALCHRVGGVGHQVAPELASVQNKSPSDLLIAILDPNREAQPNFNTYTVSTTDGRIFSGIISSEGANSITIRKAEGKEDVVLRSNIDELVASGKSLMPEGLEKELSEQDLADVIAFIKTIKPNQPSKQPSK
jgi:putative heme-binding domain-containing protein